MVSLCKAGIYLFDIGKTVIRIVVCPDIFQGGLPQPVGEHLGIEPSGIFQTVQSPDLTDKLIGDGGSTGVVGAEVGGNGAVFYLKIADHRVTHIFVYVETCVFRVNAGQKDQPQSERADHGKGALLVPAQV